MRVLHLIESLGRGGAEHLLVTLLPALAREGIEPMVGVLHGPFDLEDELNSRGIDVIRLPVANRWNVPAAATNLRMACREHDIALVHAHLYFPSIYASYAAWRGGAPMVETFHNLAYAGANAKSWKLALRRHLRAMLLKRGGSRFFGVSGAVAQHYSTALGLERVDVLPNVIDLDRIDGISTPTARKGERLRIAVPGRLVKEKGHADLIDAIARADLPPVELVFIGGGPMEVELAGKAAAKGIDLHVTGAVPHSDFLQHIDAADLIAIPSRHEGFGIAAAEAMALGKPVIATRAGGLPEVVADAGVLVETGDVAALASALEDLCRDGDLRRALGQRARQSAVERFGPGPAAQQLAAEYRAIVARS